MEGKRMLQGITEWPEEDERSERYCADCGRSYIEEQLPADGQHLCHRCRRLQDQGSDQWLRLTSSRPSACFTSGTRGAGRPGMKRTRRAKIRSIRWSPELDRGRC